MNIQRENARATMTNDYEAALDAAVEIATTFLTTLPDRHVNRLATPEAMAAALDEPLSDRGCDPAAAVTEWFTRAEAGIVASAGPRYFGYVIGGSTPAALAGDWLASAIDQNAGMWATSPAAAQTEVVVLRWLKELFDLPAGWAGTLTSGATISNLVGLAAARQWAGRMLGFDAAADGLSGHPVIPVLSSTEIHASAVKSLGTLGFGRNSVRRIPAPGGRVDLAALERELALIDGPVIVIANAAEVNTGQFDDIDALATLRDRHPGGAWLHVDAAFGLFARVSPRLRHLADGIQRADSVGSDGHKWLNVPYDCGFAFVREEALLIESFSAGGAYLAGASGWDAYAHVPEMSRRFRALAAWCALKSLGRAGYREIVERSIDNAAAFASWIDATPGFELMNSAPLNVVCFRLVGEELDDEGTDRLNRAAAVDVQRDGRAVVTGTVWNGRAAIRAAFDNWQTTLDDIAILQDVLSDVSARLRSSPSVVPLAALP